MIKEDDSTEDANFNNLDMNIVFILSLYDK